MKSLPVLRTHLNITSPATLFRRFIPLRIVEFTFVKILPYVIATNSSQLAEIKSKKIERIVCTNRPHGVMSSLQRV